MPSLHTDAALEPLPQLPGLSRRVHLKLEHLIITRVLPPGARLVEGDLAQMLGVSRGPVRAALQQLGQDGFVELRERQGAFVHIPTPKEINDFYDIRRVLEGEAARLAATRITPQGAARLRDCVEAENKLLAKDEDPAKGAYDLHQIIASIADNNELTQYLALHTKRSIWYQAPFEAARRRHALDEHAAIVAAIIRGDAAAAAAAMQAHIDRARARAPERKQTAGNP